MKVTTNTTPGLSLKVGDKITFGFPVFGWLKGTKFWLAPGRRIVPYPVQEVQP